MYTYMHVANNEGVKLSEIPLKLAGFMPALDNSLLKNRP